ncbi:MAG: acyltransferase [Gemmatimonadaceae bacterium]|nr:acyltransferase [Gemmatimonadaceae bacterium]
MTPATQTPPSTNQASTAPRPDGRALSITGSQRRITGSQPSVRRSLTPPTVRAVGITHQPPEAAAAPRLAAGPDRKGAMAPITGLRWVVSLWVVLLHTSFGAIAADIAPRYVAQGGILALAGYILAALGRFAAFAFAGTSLFLVLGGYALAVGTLSPEHGGMTRSAKSLWRSRLLRFAPLLVLTQALRIPQFILAHGDRPWGDVAASIGVNLLGQQAWFPTYVWDLNDPSWTMTVLLTSWALFPWIGPRIARLTPRAALAGLVAGITFSLSVATVVLLVHGESNADHTATDYWLSWLHTNPLVRIPEFLVGVLLARVHRGYAGWIAARAQVILSIGVVALLVACILNTVVVPYVLMHNGIVIPIACLLFLGLTEIGAAQRAGTDAPQTPLARLGSALTRWLGRPVFQRLGGAGFSLYLLHGVPLAGLIIARNLVVGRPLLFGGRPESSSLWELVLALLYVAISGVVALHAHEKVVEPLTRWLGKRLRFWAAPAPQLSPAEAVLAVAGAEATPERARHVA